MKRHSLPRHRASLPSALLIVLAIVIAPVPPAHAATAAALATPCSGFETPVRYEVGGWRSFPVGLAIADFNGDRNADLAVTAYDTYGTDDTYVAILLGSRSGAFTSHGRYPLGIHPTSVVAADFNGDRAEDLAITNTGSGTVSILFGDGTGAFTDGGEYGAGDYPRSIRLADLNEDGHADLVMADSGGAKLVALLGSEAGTFTLKVVALDNPWDHPMSVAVGDFNRDGHQDLAATLYDQVKVMFGAGDATFSSGGSYVAYVYLHDIVAADLNGDRTLDLVTANYATDTVSVFVGRADGSFANAVNYAVGTTPFGISAGDLDGDRHPDLAVANMNSGDLSILRGKGDGSFGPAESIPLGWSLYTVAIADLNNDRRADLAAVHWPYVSVLLNGCPAAQAFVTGGGWIESPAGAVAADPAAAGKATFGFSAKYVKGSDIPVGHTEFHLSAAAFRFDSTSYEKLIVDGATAEYWGSGQVNGRGRYAFRITATDGQLLGAGTPDGFRLEVWDGESGATVYDSLAGAATSTTPIRGGSIVIH